MSTSKEPILQNGHQRKKQQFWNSMYVMLLKVYCSSFSAAAVCTLDRLMVNLCFWLPSVKKKGIHEIYWMKSAVDVYSGECSAWYMKKIWKLQHQFADTKPNWFLGYPSSSAFIYYCTSLYFLPLIHMTCNHVKSWT